MTQRRVRRRAGSPGRIWLAVLLLVMVAVATPAAAQVRPDTVPRDTVRVPIPPEAVEPDTVPDEAIGQEPADSLVPAPHLPEFPDRWPVGWAAVRWQWDREALLRFQGLSLLELLERVPGVVVTRSGGAGSPAGFTTFGHGGGRLRVFRDGWEMDPLSSATLDLQQIGLADLESVRVERSLTGIRVELQTFRLPDSRPYSQVEIGTGTPQARLLRALLSRTVGTRNVITGGYDRATTGGYRFGEPFSFSSARVRWTHSLSPRSGLALEYRQTGVERESDVYPEMADRGELILRGRAQPLSGLTLDAMVGRATRRAETEDTMRIADLLPVPLAATQAAIRAGYVLGLGQVEATARLRAGDQRGFASPGTDLSLRTALQPLAWLGAEAGVRATTLQGEWAAELEGAARVGPFRGFSLVASASAGERWVGRVRDTTVVVVDTQRVNDRVQVDSATETRFLFPADRSQLGGVRAGVEWSGWGATLGVAALALEAGHLSPLGYGFDRDVPAREYPEAQGVEAFASLPLPVRGVRVEGWYARWLELGGRPYLPQEHGRLGLVYHDVRVEGQFEPMLRVDAVYRGSSLAPAPDQSSFAAVTDPYLMLNLLLQLRILDVRAFLMYENLLNNQVAADLPERELPGPRILYGVRWHFRN